MNELKTFNNAELGSVRSLMVDGEPYFVGKDVADILGYLNGSRDINRHVDEEDRRKIMIFDGNQDKEMIIINESGLYALILGSKLPSAKRFKHWVTSEVLPSIQRTGNYGISVAKQFELFDKASKISEQITPEVYPYLCEVLSHRDDLDSKRLSRVNLKGTLVGLTDEDKAAIDHAFDAYAAIYNYYRGGGSRSTDAKTLVANWGEDVGSAILNSAAFFGRRYTGPKITDNSRMSFTSAGINRDGTVRIPKIGTFHVDPEIALGGNQVSSAIVTREPNGSYTIQFNPTKQEREN